MKMRIATVLLFCVIGQAAFAESKLKNDVWEVKKGLWEVTSLIEMHGLPVELPAVTNQQCFDKDNAVPKAHNRMKIVMCPKNRLMLIP